MGTSWRPDARTRRKYDAAAHLGLMDELREKGWAGLSAKDTGRIGGMLRGANRKETERE